jgi:nucleotide-binding universal stress UspA family protein
MGTVSLERPIVAGIDGREGGLQAAAYAASMADRLHRPLTLIHAYRGAPVINPLLPLGDPRTARVAVTAVAYAPYSAGGNAELVRMAGERALQAAQHAVAQSHPHVRVTLRSVEGSPAKALVKESAQAFAVVVGRTRANPLDRILSGSTTTALLAHAKAPTIIVPPGWSPGGTPAGIVVGIEGAPSETAALKFAFDTASSTGEPLVALHANRFLEYAHGDFPTLEAQAAGIADADRRVIAESMAGWQELYPDVHTDTAYSLDGPANALMHRSHIASLVVVGARAHGGFKGLRLGSTARSLALHAGCPLAVVPSRRAEKSQRSTPETVSMSATPMY